MGKNAQVMIVDDDPDIVLLLQVMLEDAGYSVLTTENGEDVEKLTADTLPQLIILDMFLSGKDGRVLARHLKQQEYTRNVPILMLSAHPMAELEARLAGADAFLAKPFEIDDVLAKVEAYVPL